MSDTERKTLSERIDQDGITVADWSSQGFHADVDGWEHQRYTITLGMGDRTMVVPFRTGMAWERVPDASDVLSALLSDASTVENSDGFEDWAGDLGYDIDSRKAETTYRLCVEQTEKLRVFLGDQYEAFLWETDDES